MELSCQEKIISVC